MIKHPRLVLALAALVALAGLGAAYLLLSPRLLEVSPAEGLENVRGVTPLRMTFSRPLQTESLRAHLNLDPPRSGSFDWEGNTLIFTPQEPWPSAAQVTVRLEKGVWAAGNLSLPTRREWQWSFTVRHPQLVYLYPSSGPADLYLLDPHTGAGEQLVTEPGALLEYSSNAQGTALYYNTSHGDGGSSLYRLDLIDGENTLLLRCPQALCRYPQVSPAEDYLAYERTSLAAGLEANRPAVWLLPLHAVRETGGDPAAPHKFSAGEPFLVDEADQRTQQPVWSPTGWLAYYNQDSTRFILYNPGDGQRASFPSQTGIAGTWSPDGESYLIPEIIIQPFGASGSLSTVSSIPSSHLILYHMGSGQTDDLTAADDLEDATPAYAPDGKTLAFGRKYLDLARWTPGRQLWLLDLQTGTAAAVTADPYYNHYDIAWSPDGTQLAYVRFNKDALTEPPEIWLVKADGSAASRLVAGGYAPRWIP